MARPFTLVAGGADARPGDPLPVLVDPGRGERPARWPWAGPPTLSELFATHPRDAGWTGFLLSQVAPGKGAILWVQERMAMLESGRVHPPGLPLGECIPDLIHVAARDARAALWAMEEGLRCPALGAVVGELWGDPAVLDFTATRRLAVAAERSGVACWLVRLGGTTNLSGARQRWRIASLPSVGNRLDSRAPGTAAWDAELFRARGRPPGRWSLTGETDGANPVPVAAASGDRALDPGHAADRRRA